MLYKTEGGRKKTKKKVVSQNGQKDQIETAKDQIETVKRGSYLIKTMVSRPKDQIETVESLSVKTNFFKKYKNSINTVYSI